MKHIKISNFAIDEIVSFIRKRLEITNELNSAMEEKISYNAYTVMCKNYRNLMMLEDEKKEKGEPVSMAVKNGQVLSMRRLYSISLRELEMTKSKKVFFPQDLIEDILSYVKKSLTEYGVACDVMCNENFFLREAFITLRDNMDENDEEYKKIDNFLHFLYASEDAGFNIEISGRIDVRTNGVIHITNHESRLLLKTGENGKKIDNFIPASDNVLFSRNIRFGVIYTDAGEVATLLLKNKGDNTFNAFYYNSRDYEFTDKKEIGKVQPCFDFKFFLNYHGLGDLYKEIYSSREISSIIEIINNKTANNEDINSQIEKIADIVCEWWLKATSNPKFDNGDTSKVGAVTMLLAMRNNSYMPNLSEDDKSRFKEALRKRIKMELLSNRRLCLSVDYNPDKILSDAAHEAGIAVDFPWKTHMDITLDSVKVSCGYGAPYEIIFQRKKEEDVKKLSLDNNKQKKMDY